MDPDQAVQTPLPNPVPPAQQPGSSRNFLLIGFIAFVAFLLGSGVMYLFAVKGKSATQTPSPTPSPIVQASPTLTSNPTANWKIYINTKYGYLIKYPETLNTHIPKNASNVFIMYLTDKKDEYIEVEIGSLSSLGINQDMGNDMQRLNPTKTNFQNKPAVSIRPARNIYPGEPFKAVIVYIEDKNFKIEIGYYGDGKNETLFDQILQTFKFTDQSPTLGPTSTNSEGPICGGLAGETGDKACPQGYYCKYPQVGYPDATGICVKK